MFFGEINTSLPPVISAIAHGPNLILKSSSLNLNLKFFNNAQMFKVFLTP